ncbi:MAG: hypothetical protein JO119_04125 [Acidobacteria bacterium]|nr:hypothetical protein [Acidobacteriota bacterium]
MALRLEFEPENQRTFGPCDCCGNMTQRVWGFLYEGDAAVAAYFVEWTPGHAADDATFDFIVGPWGDDDGSKKSQRKAVSLHLRRLETGPSFMVVDATQRPLAENSLVGKALRREQVIGHPIAQKVFAMCDAIWLQDPRISDLRTQSPSTSANKP